MIEYLVYAFGGCLILLAVLVFHKYKKPPKRVEESVSEREFQKGEGAIIEYDRGLEGSPYSGHLTKLTEHGDLINMTLTDDDGCELPLYNLDTGEMGNLKLVSSNRDLLHNKVKFLCNKDATGEIKLNTDGTVWSYSEKTENAVLANLMAERRAYSKTLRDSDEFRQLIKLRAPSFYAEQTEEESKPEEKGSVKKT